MYNNFNVEIHKPISRYAKSVTALVLVVDTYISVDKVHKRIIQSFECKNTQVLSLQTKTFIDSTFLKAHFMRNKKGAQISFLWNPRLWHVVQRINFYIATNCALCNKHEDDNQI